MEVSLEQLYTAHFRALYRYAVGLTGNVDEANDIVQNVFMRIASRTHKGATLNPINQGYLFAAVRNGAKDFWKRTHTTPLSQIHAHTENGDEVEWEIPDENPGVLARAEVASDFDAVLKALQTLSEERREIISLKYFSGYSTQEIAGMLQKTENAVRQAEFRALGALKHALSINHNHHI